MGLHYRKPWKARVILTDGNRRRTPASRLEACLAGGPTPGGGREQSETQPFHMWKPSVSSEKNYVTPAV